MAERNAPTGTREPRVHPNRPVDPNGRLLNVVGWVTTIVMGVAGIGLIVTSIFG